MSRERLYCLLRIKAVTVLYSSLLNIIKLQKDGFADKIRVSAGSQVPGLVS